MKFKTYLDSVYMETRFSLENDDTPYKRAKLSATKNLSDLFIVLLKGITFFDIIGNFALIKFRLIKPPKTAQELFKEANEKLDKSSEKAQELVK